MTFISVQQMDIYLNLSKLSFQLQEILYVNLIKLPILVSVIPIVNEISFDIDYNSDSTNQKKNTYFLYNPWDKEKSPHVELFCTKNSYQYLSIEMLCCYVYVLFPRFCLFFLVSFLFFCCFKEPDAITTSSDRTKCICYP